MLKTSVILGQDKIFLPLTQNIEFSGYTKIINNFKKLPYFSTFTSKLSRKSKKIKLFFIINKVQQALKKIKFFLLFEVKKWVKNFTMSSFIDGIRINGNILLTKDFRTSLKKKIFFYVFLRRKKRFKEIIKWLYYLTHLQSYSKLYQRLGILFFDSFHFYDSSELRSIQKMIIKNYKHKNIFVKLPDRRFKKLAKIIF